MAMLEAGVADFVDRYNRLVDSWKKRLAELKATGGRAVIWGSGSKGVSFISNLGLTDEIEAAVDINPYKWGKFMVGSDHRIIGPDDLIEIQPDLIVAMNPIYLSEIQADLDARALTSELVAL